MASGFFCDGALVWKDGAGSAARSDSQSQARVKSILMGLVLRARWFHMDNIDEEGARAQVGSASEAIGVGV